MATPKVPVNPAVLVWAREIAGYSPAAAAKALGVKSSRLDEWEAGTSHPTIGQLRKIAHLYRRTPAVFFLPQPPEPDLPTPPDFRSASHQGDLSPALRRELRRAVEKRKTYLALGGAPENLVERWTVDFTEREEAAAIVRERLGVTVDEQTSARDEGAALNRWIAAVEEAGVLVSQMSRIDLGETRGFSIYDDPSPVIVLNGGDPPQARSFTLMHELCHLLNKSGGVCDIWSARTMERRCNAFAADLLMPRAAFLALLGDEDPVEAVPTLARRFRVSRDAAAIRLRELNRLTQKQVEEIRAENARLLSEQKQKEKESDGGPAYHRTHLRNLGPRYVSTVLEALDSDTITLVDAAHYLEAKVTTIDRMSAELEGRAHLGG